MKILLFAVLSFFSGGIVARADDPAILRTQRGEVPAAIRAIQAGNPLGDVTVTAVTEGFGWEWNLRVSGDRTARVEAYAQDWRMEVREINGVLQMDIVRPETSWSDGHRNGEALRRFLSWATLGVVSARKGSVRSHLTLRVPAASAVEVRNRFGHVHIAGTRGAVDVDCQNGRVDLSNLEGAVTARTSFGSLRAEKIGPAQLTTRNGNLEANGVGGDLRATTAFGSLSVRDIKGNATLQNRNGAIQAARVKGDLSAATSFAEMRIEDIGGVAEVKNQNGRVDINRVSGLVRATSSFGSMRVRDAAAGADLKNENGAIEATTVTGGLLAATSFADLRVGQINGDAHLKSRNGKIEATHVTGNLRADTSFAALRVREIGGTADLDGQNSEIVATAISGDIRAQTTFGRMRLEGSGRRFIARNHNGAVEIVAHSPDVEQVEASASFAPINVRLPSDAKPSIHATTSHGRVHSDFPMLIGTASAASAEKIASDTTPLKVSLKGQNGDIRIQHLAAR
jgi:DUF4097 and DUF4098 domain-containing protein YvlB